MSAEREAERLLRGLGARSQTAVDMALAIYAARGVRCTLVVQIPPGGGPPEVFLTTGPAEIRIV